MIIFENKIILLLPKNGTHSIMMEHGVNPWDGPGSYTRLNKNDALIFLDGDSPHLPANRIPKRFEHLPNYALVRNPWFRTITRYFWTKRRNWFEEKISIDEYVEQKYFPEKLKGDYIYEELNEWSRFLRTLRELNKSSKKVKVMLISACEKQGVNYKDLASILNLTNIQFSQRVTMKVKFSTAEALLLAETLYQDESERYHFIKKLMEISQ